jgi:hypothetical protein
MLKKGDIVKRCSDDAAIFDEPDDNMFEGHYYKIRERDNGGVYLEGCEGKYSERFFTLAFRPCEKTLASQTTVEITQEEYDSLIDEINMLRELLAEAYKPTANAVPAFKPISEMTMEDWLQAQEEEGVFVDNDGDEVTLTEVFSDSIRFKEYRGNFTFYGRHNYMPKHHYIVKRIK